MAGNSDPLFSRVASIGYSTGGAISAAANDLTGISTNNVLLSYTASTDNGGFVQRIRFKAAGTNVAAVMRIYIATSTLTTIAVNNILYGEIALPAVTASTALPLPDVDYMMNMALPPSYRLMCGLGSSIASGWFPSVIGGQY
jgi:hypothetical protein